MSNPELMRKYIDILAEANAKLDADEGDDLFRDRINDFPPEDDLDGMASDLDSMSDDSDELDAPEIDQLESDADSKVVRSVIDAVRELIGQGHTDVEPSVITNMVVASTGKPFLLKDLVAVNNQSQEIQHYIDSINPSKVKFSGDILTVKNEDPAKERKQNEARVSAMAARASR